MATTTAKVLSLPMEKTWDAINVSGEGGPPPSEGQKWYEKPLFIAGVAGTVVIGGVYFAVRGEK